MIDWNWVLRTVLTVGAGFGLIAFDQKELGAGVIAGALGNAALTANRTALK